MNGWRSVRIGAVCDLMTGGTPSRSKTEYYDGGTIPWLVSGDIHRGEIHDCEGRITELGLSESNARWLPVNSVIIALNGQGKTRGTVALLRIKATCNQSLVSIHPKSAGELLPEFLFWNLHGRYEEIRRITGDDGNERRGLNMPLIRNIEIPLPPLQEQRQIVAVLDEAFAAIATATANAEKNFVDSRRAFDGWLGEAMIVTEDGDWKRHRLGELTSKIGSGATPRGGKASYRSEGTPLVRSLNVHDRRFKPEQLAFIDSDQAKQLANVTLQRDDVLLNITGASVARCCILPDDLIGGRVNQHVSIIRAKQNALIPKFLELLLTSPVYKERLLGVGHQGGSTRQAITKAEIQDFEIVVPGVEAQQVIVDLARQVEGELLRLSQSFSRKTGLLAALKQSLLSRAFSGELAERVLVAG